MIEYFKFTGGDAFTLSGVDYSGFINVRNGVVYSGKSLTTSSKVLNSKDTFLSNSFIQQKEFDRTAGPVDTTNILNIPNISPRNIINQSFIDRNLGILNQNNINLYCLNIIGNTNLLDFANSAKDGNAYFLGLSSGKNDIRNNRSLAYEQGPVYGGPNVAVPKDNLYPIQIDPFSFVDKVPDVDVLDDTIDSEIFVYDDKAYFYFTTTPTNSYTFSGSFVPGSSITRVDSGLFPKNLKFTYDNSTDTLYSLITGDAVPGTNVRQTTLKLYDNSFVNPCGNLKLTDEINLGTDPILDTSVQIGNNLLGYRVLDESGQIYIQLNNKYSHAPIATIATEIEGERILAFDIRDTDDSILILTTPKPGMMFDDDPGGDFYPYYLYQLDAQKITDLGPSLNPKLVGSWEPDYHYTKKDVVEIWFAGNDSNIFIFNDNGFITTRFISNPMYIAGFSSADNLLYPQNMFFNDTVERFDYVQKKFNTNTLNSNFYDNLNFLVTKNTSEVFYFLHNIGRIYLFREGNLAYKYYVPLDLPHLYDKITSCESSLGISLNSELQNIIKDAVNIYLNLSLIPSEIISDGIPILRGNKSYESLEVDFRNLEFHENEEVNYSVVSRVFNQIYEFQKNILDVIISDTDDEPV
tara:strand:- start:917 stop:2821 length:1905 start_codon:yes stop_codon:yes gene_type:complete